jgi:hypothetical protein
LDNKKETANLVKSLARLQQLREIHCTIGDAEYPDEDKEKEWRHKLLEMLPQVEVVGENDMTINTMSNYCGHEELGLDFDQLPKTPFQLGLQQVVLSGTSSRIPSNISLPNLKALYLIEITDKFRPDARFANVVELCLGFLCNMDWYADILGHLGHQIRRLSIMEYEDTLYLDTILQMCPNLEEFYLPETPLELDSHSKGALKVDKLQVFHVDLSNASGRPMMASGLLVRLLQAPNLRDLSITDVDLTRSDVQTIVRGLRQGSMLQNLKKFHYVNFWLDEGRMQHLALGSLEKPETKRRYDMVVEAMKLHCPLLEKIDDDGL